MINTEIIFLIISNNNDIKEVLLNIIKKKKFKDKIRIYVHENIKNIEKIRPSLIILERLEIEVFKDIKKHEKYKNTPIVVTLEQQEKEKLNQYIDMGISNYINKPYDENEIYLNLRNILEYEKAKSYSKIKEIQFDAILNNTPYMAWFKDKDSNYIKVNNDFKEHSGKDDDTIRGRDDTFVWDGHIGDRCKEFDLTVMNERKRIMFDEIIPGKKGYRQFNIYKAPVVDEYDEIMGTIGIARDITELKNNDAKLNIILENMPFRVWLKDTNGTILNANSKFVESFELSKEEVIGKNEKDILDKDNYEHTKYEDEQVIREKKTIIFERTDKVDKEEMIYEIYKSPVLDISDETIGIVGLCRDITDIRKNQEHIRMLAYTDYLTDLLNRRGLCNYLEEVFTDPGRELTAMFIDLDNFKKLNDSFGHYYGDEALKLIGNRLNNLDSKAKCARTGGDEFVIVWENIGDKNVLIDKANELLSLLNIQFDKGDRSILLSASIGIVTEKLKDFEYENLLLKGDIALYKAKEKGRNQYVIYTDSLDKEMNFNLQIEDDIKKAVTNGEINLKYQPQFTTDKELVGFEALFRWNNPKYDNVPIIELIKTIEKYDIMDCIGDFILKEAAIFSKEINEKSKSPIVVFVNISALQIMSNTFVDKFKRMLLDVNINPKLIGLELTETVLLENIDMNIKKIKELKDLGVTIALDDFGTGYSSLNYLVKLPLSKVKIDRSFISSMTKRDEYIKLVNLIVDISHSLGLPVVAEGVELNEELEILKKMDVDIIQGYLFSMPLDRQSAYRLAIDIF